MRVINIGTFPPPFGGVSIHLKRLLEFLTGKQIDNALIDITGVKKNYPGVSSLKGKSMVMSLLRENRCVLHFHFFSLKFLLLFYALSKKHIVILSFHNERFLDDIESEGKLKGRLMKALINQLHSIVVDNSRNLSIAKTFIRDESKIICIPEFIPPAQVEELEDTSILALRKKHRFIISSNAFKISFYKDQDTYGIDLLIDLLAGLREVDAAIVFLLPQIGDQGYFDFLNQKIKSLDLEQRFLFKTTPLKESCSLWAISDLVIRATNTDGNSLTVLEALSMGIPVLASDCVERPEGTLLFETRNAEDLIAKTKDFFVNKDFHLDNLKKVKATNNGFAFLNLYHQLATQHDIKG